MSTGFRKSLEKDKERFFGCEGKGAVIIWGKRKGLEKERNTMEIRKEIEEMREYLIQLRHHFHQHPEGSLQELSLIHI